MKSYRVLDTISRVVFLFICIFLFSCSISNRTAYEDEQGSVPESVFSSIKKNKTPKQWVLRHLGEPLSAYYTNDMREGHGNGEVYTYQIKKSNYRHASVLFFLRYNSVKRNPRYYHIVFHNDLVKKTWWDDHAVPSWLIDQKRPSVNLQGKVNVHQNHSMVNSPGAASSLSSHALAAQKEGSKMVNADMAKSENISSKNTMSQSQGLKQASSKSK